MNEILYVKLEKNIRTYNRTLTLGEAVQMQCADSKNCEQTEDRKAVYL